MKRRLLFNRFGALFLVSIGILLFCVLPASAYYFNDWSIDGYIKSQVGMFTEKKPFNKAQYGGSDDMLATAKQMMRWNINGQITRTIGVKAEVLGVWEPNYPSEKGAFVKNRQGIDIPMPANYYNSFDWRELTIEYKPNYSHSFKFGRQIVNWGEAVSGRVIDQCNPDDSRASSGFVNLEERYMPLWMFRGFHEFPSLRTSIEWLIAPIWQANRYEHSRGVSGDTPVGNGKTTNFSTNPTYANNPSARFTARRENRPEKIFGADIIITRTGLPSSILGAPYSTGYHASDMIGVTPTRALTRAEIINAYNSGIPYVIYQPNYYPTTAGLAYVNTTDPNATFSVLSEPPTFIATDYTDHNAKNTRWGIKTKSLLWDWELGMAFFQGPGHSPSTVFKDRADPFIVTQYVYPRYNTFGIYGNYQILPLNTIFIFESAYMPKREYAKFLMDIGDVNTPGVYEARLKNIKEIDMVTTLLGFTREQNIPWLNAYNAFTMRLQYTNYWWLQNNDDVAAIATFYMHNEQVQHNVLLSISTSYAYRKYNPSLTFSWYPDGALYSSIGISVIPEGFNGRLSISASYANYWTTNDFTTSVSLYDNLDLLTLGFKYSFY